METTTSPVFAALAGSQPAIALRPRVIPWRIVVLVGATASTALTLRAWNLHASLESSDQAALGHLLHYSFGLKWIAAHDYGPVLPAIEAAWCRLLSRLNLPIDEAAMRIPVVVMSMLQVGLTGLLMRRLGFSRAAVAAGCVVAALLPSLVSDAHYLWAYQTTWLLFGTLAIWATLAWQREGRRWQLVLAAIALFLHCLSSLYSYALPLILLVAWVQHLRGGRQLLDASDNRQANPPTAAVVSADRPRDLRAFLIAWVLPCLAALAAIVVNWHWTGRGQIGRLLLKHRHGVSGLHLEQFLELPRLWSSQLGPVFGAVCAGAVILGLLRLRSGDRRWLPALWAFVSITVYTLLSDWDRIGYAPHYTFEAVYAGTLLGAAWLADAVQSGHYRRFVAIPLALVAGLQLGLGAIDVGRPDLDLRMITGIRSEWGEVRPDSGAKAAGYYIRRFVPADATVLSLHTRIGMELPVAEYYCGRRVLAHYDLPEELLAGLWQALKDRVDVVVIEPAQARLFSGDNLYCVAMLRRGGRVVRMILARPELELPRRDVEVSLLNAAYDREYVPRKLPMPLPAPPDFLADLAHYQQSIAELCTARSVRLARE